MTEVKSLRQNFVIGIDLDNTIVCYDELFHLAACEEGLIEPSLPKNKEKIRDAIRLLPDGENRWTRLQAIVYGPRMHAARLFEGVDIFLRHCAELRVQAMIVSHKTQFATLDGQRVDLRRSALKWLETKGFFSDFGLSPGDVFFESTRAEKIERIRTLRCTHFIDDLAEVFAEEDFPHETKKMFFAPHGVAFTGSGAQPFASWLELDRHFFPATDDSDLQQDIREVLLRDLKKTARAFQKLKGGRNSRVFRVDCEDGSAVAVKAYFQSAQDHRDRMGNEFRALQFLKSEGLREVPAPLAADEARHIAAYEFVPGQLLRAEEIGEAEIGQAVEFLRKLKLLADSGKGQEFSDRVGSVFFHRGNSKKY